VFNLAFLHVIREFEYQRAVRYFKPRARILEIGGGSGYQARRLSEDGYVVESIDLPTSNYAQKTEFPVQPYDGRNLPFPNASFDVVFSSNVLEHVQDLPFLEGEMRCVLKPGGYCVHVMPTGAWRLWTNVAHYVELLQRLVLLVPRVIPSAASKQALRDAVGALRQMAATAKSYAIVPRHGEHGNALSELATFSAHRWRKHFWQQRFVVEKVVPMGLFYTGHMVLGSRLPLRARRVLARILGSACAVYVVRPV